MSGTIRVLHVDDDPELSAVVRDFLTREGDFAITTATSAAEGLDVLESEPIECVVSDYEMPETDGLSFLADVREAYPDLPFLLFTSKGSEEIASEAISAGVTDYLRKRASSEQYTVLANRIENAVSRYRAERRFDEERERLAALFENATDPIVETTHRDGELIVQRVNAAFESTFGYESAEVVGRPVGEVLIPADEAKRTEYAAIRSRVIDGERVERDVERETVDGVRTFLMRVVPFETESGGRGTYAIYTDVTEREEREREFQEMSETLEAVIRASPDAVVMVDLDGRVKLWNEAAERLFGWREEEVLGEPNPIIPEERRAEFEEIRDMSDEGESVTGLETRRRRKDGELIDVSVSTGQVRDESGEIKGHMAVIEDITDRKRRDRALESLHETTRALMEAESKEEVSEIAVEAAHDVLDMPITGIWLYDEEAEALEPAVRTAASEDLFEEVPTYTADAESLSWEAFVDGEVRAYGDVRGVEGAHNPETEIRSELILPLGEYGVMNVGSTDADRFDGTDRRFAEILAANTEAALERAEREATLKAQRRELERQNQRLEEFASVASHDLRNPLTTAAGFLDVARDEVDDGEVDDLLARVDESLDRMEELIVNVLARAREGQDAWEAEPVDLSAAAEAAWANAGDEAATLRVEVDGGTVLADEGRLRRLLENLFRNAIEHGRPDATVRVGRFDGGFYVADDGPGIPPEERDRVFASGYSGDDGTGLGLGIVRNIVDAHDWEVRLTESDEGGARFEFVVPEDRSTNGERQ